MLNRETNPQGTDGLAGICRPTAFIYECRRTLTTTATFVPLTCSVETMRLRLCPGAMLPIAVRPAALGRREFRSGGPALKDGRPDAILRI